MTALEITVKAIDAGNEWQQVRFGWPTDRAGWTLCADVDAVAVAGWEARMAASIQHAYGACHPMTVSGFTLDGYASIAASLGAAVFRLSQRVPRLGRRSVGFRCHPQEQHIDGLALLDPRFWCLPDDPAAGEREATVVPDAATLAALLRAQVRTHADDFLAGYVPGAKLPRRHLIGAFFDALDTGLWYGAGAPDVTAAAEVLAVTGAVLPGGTAEFRAASTVHVLTDTRGRKHLSRRRVGCCYYYKSAPDGEACSTCPRVDDETRTRRYADVD